MKRHLRQAAIFDINRSIVSCRFDAKCDCSGATCLRSPLPQPGLIGVDHRKPVITQTFKDLTFGAGDGINIFVVGKVRSRCIEAHRNVGRGQFAEITDIARPTRTHLDHGKLMG